MAPVQISSNNASINLFMTCIKCYSTVKASLLMLIIVLTFTSHLGVQ